MFEIRDIGRTVYFEGNLVGYWTRTAKKSVFFYGEGLPNIEVHKQGKVLEELNNLWLPILSEVKEK